MGSRPSWGPGPSVGLRDPGPSRGPAFVRPAAVCLAWRWAQHLILLMATRALQGPEGADQQDSDLSWTPSPGCLVWMLGPANSG